MFNTLPKHDVCKTIMREMLPLVAFQGQTTTILKKVPLNNGVVHK